MSSVSPDDGDHGRLGAEVRTHLRAATAQITLLGRHVGARLDIRDTDFECLDLIGRHGPLAPSALARLAGLHPATITGVLDRLEKGGWIVRERDTEDRRAVRVRAVPERGERVLGLYAGMNGSMAEILGGYGTEELAVIADFLRRTADAGRAAVAELAAKETS
jgi:DNA-binding MarR family transcriptional regulator